ncbi:hypothetical protein Mal48_10420 [Thalassoglobus polymorphus]|uniref:Uncharacterized protein n=1 Tax=Thalassoglobus polymorphus TaxID=2527994 RepID=A0A517QJJ4_9PLAN|nr:hypothetical protein Mal48_10420 [Thalassoglobus polymorphus]
MVFLGKENRPEDKTLIVEDLRVDLEIRFGILRQFSGDGIT